MHFPEHRPFVGIVFGYNLAAHRYAGVVHGIRVAAQQWMPVLQLLTKRQQAVRTGSWQPFKCLGRIGGELQTVGYQLGAVAVVSTTASLGVEQLAGQVGIKQFTTVFVLHLVHAAQAAAVAQRLPFRRVHLGKRFAFPELIGHRAHHA